jgi:hypothetical protein
MALTGIYNSSDREIVLNSAQANIFNQTIQYFKTNGVGGDNVFEDTYVLQKRVAEYIKENMGGVLTMNTQSAILQVYNGVLGISSVGGSTSGGTTGSTSGGTTGSTSGGTTASTSEGTTASTSEGTTGSTSGGTTGSTSGGTTASTSEGTTGSTRRRD